ncbi:5-formyltetrahydrofolate cyclo-ligase [Brachybacterium timonense]|uniref:5-formyltetrahydrofolate cyclo-ligase n=1 Tax=Brachybacterium timonense TaxID=2050896 RepID=UPI000D0BD801|nr:5-formyltetrahydrofolate cyclo-ligase [Brachybacterium timonense]
MTTPTSPADVKKALRRRLRTERAQRYEGESGQKRRADEAARLALRIDDLLDMLGPASTEQSPTAVEHAQPSAAHRDPSAVHTQLSATGTRLLTDQPLVSAFSPMLLEADVMVLVRALLSRGARTLFPVDTGTEALDWALWDGTSEFVRSPGRGFGSEPTGPRLGIDALRTAHLVLAPALAVDRSGTRLGHGGGYYDRALRHVRPGVRVVAVVHPHELVEAGTLPQEPHDRRVDAVLTADELWTVPSAA